MSDPEPRLRTLGHGWPRQPAIPALASLDDRLVADFAAEYVRRGGDARRTKMLTVGVNRSTWSVATFSLICRSLILGLGLLAASPTLAGPVDASALFGQLDKTALDPAAARVVENLEFASGPAHFRIVKGLLTPTTPVGDAPGEVIFVGEGRVVFDPADDVEKQQLDLFTGASTLDCPLADAVFVAPPAELVAALRAPASSAPAAGDVEKARKIFDEWSGRPERRHYNVLLSLLRRAAGDRRMDTFFAAWLKHPDRGRFVYELNPTYREQVELWQFTPLTLTEDQKFQLQIRLYTDLREGRLRAVDLDALGTFDNWVRMPLRDVQGAPETGAAGVEPRKYDLDLKVAPDGEQVSGRAKITFETTAAGVSTLDASILSDLAVSFVTGADGKPLPFRQEGGRVVVFLPAPLGAGETGVVQFGYAGTLFNKVGRAIKFHAMYNWHPHLGDRDRTTYDVTLHWPKKYDVIACGRELERSEEGDLQRERRVLETPSSAFAFALGKFKTIKKSQGHLTVTAAFDASARDLRDSEREAYAQDFLDTFQFFEEMYGRFPMDEVTAVWADASGAAVPGFLTSASTGWYPTALEVAEQWWGGMVETESYRDSWLLLALRNYAADLYGRRVRKDRTPEVWWDSLDAWTKGKRNAESVGPIVLGKRLDSSLCSCWSPVVYKKGNRVFETLANLVGEEAFEAALREGFRGWKGQTLSTSQFMAFVQKKHGRPLDWFTQRYILGTGLVDIYYTYEFEPGPTGWKVKLVFEQLPHRVYTVRVVRRPDGKLDVYSRPLGAVDAKNSMLKIPVRIPLKPLAEETKTNDRRRSGKSLTGVVVLDGPHKETTIDVPYEPESVQLDPQNTVLAYSFCETCSPKWTLRRRGFEKLRAGDLEGAEVLLNRAMTAPARDAPPPERGGARMVYDRWVSSQDALTQLYLAQAAMERGEFDEAWKNYREARKRYANELKGEVLEEFTVVEARLRLRQGDVDGAWRLLWRQIMDGERHTGEGWLLLGIAAKSQGEEEALQKALTHAAEIGVDGALLNEKPPGSE